MKYDIYFHHDLDGAASAAVMLNFLHNRGDEARKIEFLDFSIEKDWVSGKFPKDKKQPFIVLDFMFHPAAAIWFDHHGTAFRSDDWEKNFKPDKAHFLGPDYLSCCHLVLDQLVKNFGYKPPRFLKDLAKWADIIDSAKYKTAKQTIEVKDPAIELSYLIRERLRDDKKLFEWTVRRMSESPISEIMKDRMLAKLLPGLKRELKASLRFYRKNLQIHGPIGFIDISTAQISELRFAPFYLFPQLKYSLALKPGGTNTLHLTLGVNPWKAKQNKIDLGMLMRKMIGGGGHFNVGGGEIAGREKAEKFADELIQVIENRAK